MACYCATVIIERIKELKIYFEQGQSEPIEQFYGQNRLYFCWTECRLCYDMIEENFIRNK